MGAMTLTEFLLARIHEDEKGARAWNDAYNNAGPVPSYHREVAARHRKEWPTLWRSLDTFTPERVLAECEAKRRMLDMAVEVAMVELDLPFNQWHDDPGVKILCALALPYANHPDYLPEWKP